MSAKSGLWFLVWRRPGQRPHVTSICAYTRRDLLDRIKSEVGSNWPKLRRHWGARAERIDVDRMLTL